jgi:hypothetical protein
MLDRIGHWPEHHAADGVPAGLAAPPMTRLLAACIAVIACASEPRGSASTTGGSDATSGSAISSSSTDVDTGIATTLAVDTGTSTDSTTGDMPPACVPGNSPGGGLVWSADGHAGQPNLVHGAFAPLPDGGFVALGSWATEADDEPDAFVGAYSESGELRWSARYDGAAGLTDAPIAAAVGDDGFVHVLVQESLSEVWHEGYASSERRLVLLRYGPDGEEVWRWVWEPSRPPPIDEYPLGTVAIVDGEDPMIVRWTLDLGVLPEARRLDRWGNELNVFALGQQGISGLHVRQVVVSPRGAVIVGGDIGPTDLGWVGAYEPDGTLRWSHEVSPNLAIAAAPDDQTIVASGGATSLAHDDAITVARYAADGAVVWTTSIAAPASGGQVEQLAVHCDGTATFVGDVVTSSGLGADLWLVHVDSGGRELWQTRHAFPEPHGHGYASRVVVLAGGDVLAGAIYLDATGSVYAPWLGYFTGGA